jgi:hypothetical protein
VQQEVGEREKNKPELQIHFLHRYLLLEAGDDTNSMRTFLTLWKSKLTQTECGPCYWQPLVAPGIPFSSWLSLSSWALACQKQQILSYCHSLCPGRS